MSVANENAKKDSFKSSCANCCCCFKRRKQMSVSETKETSTLQEEENSPVSFTFPFLLLFFSILHKNNRHQFTFLKIQQNSSTIFELKLSMMFTTCHFFNCTEKVFTTNGQGYHWLKITFSIVVYKRCVWNLILVRYRQGRIEKFWDHLGTSISLCLDVLW